MNKKLKLQNNLNNAIKPGNVIGLGESSHGSGTEFQFKVDFMIDTIKSSPNSRFNEAPRSKLRGISYYFMVATQEV
jgi:hypothetical protein